MGKGMQEYTILGPRCDGLMSREAVAECVGMKVEALEREVAQGRFPEGIKPTPQGKPVWSPVDVACWVHIQRLLRRNPEANEKEKSE